MSDDPRGIQKKKRLNAPDFDRAVKQEQALVMKVVGGASYREIARMFEISDHTAKNWVKKARQNERMAMARGIISERLVPMAIAVYEERLNAGDIEAARDVLFGTNILQRNAKVSVEAVQDPLQRFREKYFGGEPAVEAEVVGTNEPEH